MIDTISPIIFHLNLIAPGNYSASCFDCKRQNILKYAIIFAHFARVSYYIYIIVIPFLLEFAVSDNVNSPLVKSMSDNTQNFIQIWNICTQ